MLVSCLLLKCTIRKLKLRLERSLRKRLILALPIYPVYDGSRHVYIMHSLLGNAIFLSCFSFKIKQFAMSMDSVSRTYLKCLFFFFLNPAYTKSLNFYFVFSLSWMNLSSDILTTLSHEQTFSILLSSALAKELFKCKTFAS